MHELSFEELIQLNCYSEDRKKRQQAAWALEERYGCEIHVQDMAKNVLFAHHARGCTLVAARLSPGVVIYQQVTLGSNMKYNKISKVWENVGSPILGENVIVAAGAKILGPVIIGKNTVVEQEQLLPKIFLQIAWLTG